LKVFATEIEGLWGFYPLPGLEVTDEKGNTVLDENGNPVINNVAVSACSAIVMIVGCDNEYNAWQFMKWHVGAECQSDYSEEMCAIIGPSAKHSTANLEALQDMPWTTEELKQLQAQFNTLASIPNYPGSYIIGRYTHFAFLSAYNDNEDPTEELLSYITTINKEITRKREEFELETLELGSTLAEKRMDQASTALDVLKSKYNNAAYAAVFEEAEAVIANSKIAKNEDYATIVPMLQNVAEKIMEFLPDEGTATPSYYVKVSKQTALEKNGGYAIDSLSEQKLLYFTAQCLLDAAKAFNSYR
jgi:hypothetical protein